MKYKLAALLTLVIVSGSILSCSNTPSASTNTNVKSDITVSNPQNITLLAYQDINGNVTKLTKKNIITYQSGKSLAKSVSDCISDCPPISDYGINTKGSEAVTLKVALPVGNFSTKAETNASVTTTIVIPYNVYNNFDGNTQRKSLIYLIKEKDISKKKKFAAKAVENFYETSGAEVNDAGKVIRVASIQSSDEKDLTFFTADKKVMGYNSDEIIQSDVKPSFSREITADETKFLDQLKNELDNALAKVNGNSSTNPDTSASVAPSPGTPAASQDPQVQQTPAPATTATPSSVPTPVPSIAGPAPEKISRANFANGVEYNSFNRFNDNKVLCQTTKHWESGSCSGGYDDETQFLFIGKVKMGEETKYYHDISSAEIGDWKEGDKVSVMMYIHNSSRTHLDDIYNKTFMAHEAKLNLNIADNTLSSEIIAKNAYSSDQDYQNNKDNAGYTYSLKDTANSDLPSNLKLIFDPASPKVKWFRNKPVSDCESFKTGEVADCSVDSDPDSSKFTIKDNQFDFNFGDFQGGYYFSQWVYVNLIVAKK